MPKIIDYALPPGGTIIEVADNLPAALDIEQAGADYITVDTTDGSEQVIIGKTLTLEAGSTYTGDLTVQDADIILRQNAADAVADTVIFQKSRNATDGSHTIVADNDVLGTVEFKGSDGDSFESGAKIFARVNGTPSAGTDMPTELVFAISQEGSATPGEFMNILNTTNAKRQVSIGGYVSTAGTYSPLAVNTDTQNGSIFERTGNGNWMIFQHNTQNVIATSNHPFSIVRNSVEKIVVDDDAHWSNARQLVVKGPNHAGIIIQSSADSYGGNLGFADGTGTSAEGVGCNFGYNHAGDYLRLFLKYNGTGSDQCRWNEYGSQRALQSIAYDSTALGAEDNVARSVYLADSGATLILDQAYGTIGMITLTANVTAIKIWNSAGYGSGQTMTVRIKQHASSAKTVSYASVTVYSDAGSTTKAGQLLWSGGAAHTMSTGTGEIDIVQFTVLPNGDTDRDVYGCVIGQDFS